MHFLTQGYRLTLPFDWHEGLVLIHFRLSLWGPRISEAVPKQSAFFECAVSPSIKPQVQSRKMLNFIGT